MHMRIVTTVLTLLPLVSAGLGAADDLSGKWAFAGDVQGNAFTLNCDVTQGADATLAGQCEVNGATSALTGTVKETDVQFSVTVSGYALTYTGRVQGDTVTGGIEVSGATGTFSGTRAKG
jgi:hypothetical protein